MTDEISTEELIEELQRLADELEKTPTQREMNEHGAYSAPTYQYRFGWWNRAVKTAGLEPNKDAAHAIPREDLLNELQRLADELGQPPSKRQMKDQGVYSAKPYRNQFGSWNAAIEAAGLEPHQLNNQTPSGDLLDEIRRLADELGKTPSTGDMKQHGRYSHTTYKRRFGSWNEAIESAGLEPNGFGGRRPGEYPNAELLDALQNLAIELERTPEYEDVATYTDIDPDLYLDRWDSWWVACSMAGVSQADLVGVFETDTEEEVA